eukprot:3378172-Pyramimonas_sp.AAC.1
MPNRVVVGTWLRHPGAILRGEGGEDEEDVEDASKTPTVNQCRPLRFGHAHAAKRWVVVLAKLLDYVFPE